MKQPQRWLGIVALSLAACGPSRQDEIDACWFLVGRTGLSECLVSRYDWKPRDALRVELDSLRTEINQQEKARVDSLRRADTAAQRNADSSRP